MFNVLKGHKSKSPIQKHILTGSLRLSKCLLNVISAVRVHQHWHWKAPGATVPPPSAVQPYPTSPAMVSRHWLMPGHSFSTNVYMPCLPFQHWFWQTLLFRKLRGPWFTVICHVNTNKVIISAFQMGSLHTLHAPVSTYQRSVTQDSRVGGVRCILPAICGTSCALSLLGFYRSVLLVPLLKKKKKRKEENRELNSPLSYYQRTNEFCLHS